MRACAEPKRASARRGESPLVLHIYQVYNKLLILSPSGFAVCGHDLSPWTAIVDTKKKFVVWLENIASRHFHTYRRVAGCSCYFCYFFYFITLFFCPLPPFFPLWRKTAQTFVRQGALSCVLHGTRAVRWLDFTPTVLCSYKLGGVAKQASKLTSFFFFFFFFFFFVFFSLG